MGCHFLLQCMRVKSESEVTELCPALSDPMDCSLPGSSIHGIFQARVLEWVPLPSPMNSLIKLKRVYNYNHKQEKKCVSQKRCGSYNEPLPAPLAGEFYSNSPGYTAAPPTPKNPAYTRVAMNTAEAQNWGSEGKSLTFKGTHSCILAV